MTLGKAIELLKAKYQTALSLEYIQNPTAWALYRVWQIADRDGNGVKKHEWISVDDRLPEKSGYYLVVGDDKDDSKCWICEFLILGNIGGWANDVKHSTIKAWKPLP